MNVTLLSSWAKGKRKPPPEEPPEYVITWIKQGDAMMAILPYHMRFS